MPARLGRIVLGSALGSGGGGETFLGHDALSPGRILAVKIAPRGTPAKEATLVREALALAALGHRDVPAPLTLGRAPPGSSHAGRLYLARDFVAGAPLHRALVGEPYPAARRALASLCATVRDLHRYGLVHGDLKPANVLLDLATGRVAVIDLGLAVWSGRPEDDPGAGTASYLAPECARGEARSVASDLYALGVLADRLVAPLRGVPAGVRHALALWSAPVPTDRPPSVDAAWAALAAADPDAEPLEPGAGRVRDARFVGREGLLDALARGRPGRAVAVVGDDGTGKSRLLRELGWRLRAGAREVALADDVVRAGAAVLAEARGRAAVAVDAGAAVAAVGEALERGAAVLLDALDALDAPALDAVEAVLRAWDGETGTLVLAGRDGPWRARVGAACPTLEAVALGALDDGAVRAMAACLGVEGDAAGEVARLAAGNPGRAWALARRAAGDDAAPAIPALVVGLAPDALRLARVLALADLPVDVAALAHPRDRLATTQTLERLAAAGLLARDGARWTVAGALARDALVGALPPDVCCALAVEARGAVERDASLDPAARYERASALCFLAGDSLAGLVRGARATHELLARGVFARAARLAEDLAARCPFPRARRGLVARAFGAWTEAGEIAEAERVAGRDPDAVGGLLRARLEARRGDLAAAEAGLAAEVSRAPRAEAWAELAKVRMRRGDLAGARAAAEEGARDATPGSAAAIELGLARGYALLRSAQRDLARRALEEARAWAEAAGDARALARSESYLGALFQEEGRADLALEAHARAAAAAARGVDPANAPTYLLNLGVALVLAGRYGEAWRRYGEARRAARRAGQRAPEAIASANLAILYVDLGAPGDALALLAAAAPQLDASGLRMHAANALVTRGRALVALGAAAEGEAALARGAEALAQHAGEREALRAEAARAEARLARGDRAGARALADAVYAKALAHGRDEAAAEALVVRAQAQARGGEDPLPALAEAARRVEGRPWAWEVEALLGEALAARGDAGAAVHRARAEALRARAGEGLPGSLAASFAARAVARCALARGAGETRRGRTTVADVADGTDGERALIAVARAFARAATDDGATPEGVARALLDGAVQALGAERGAVLWGDDPDGLAQLAADPGVALDGAGEARELARAVLAEAWRAGATLAASTAGATRTGRAGAHLADVAGEAVVCAPLVAGGRVRGALWLEGEGSALGAAGVRRAAREAATWAAGALAQAARAGALRAALAAAEAARSDAAAALAAERARREASEVTSEGLARDLSAARAERGEAVVPGLVAEGAAMREALAAVARVAPTSVPVLVLGESGSGKELVAQALHRLSARRDRAFLALNCAAVPEHLLESELFGHARGAFTSALAAHEGLFAAADRGTLVLDEIGEMPLALQAKLLRVLESGEVRPVGTSRPRIVDVRVIAATHRDVAALVATGRFREDLLYRLDVVRVRVPPLRERADDLAPLAAQLLAQAAERHGVPRARLSAGALRALLAHAWPGNVRELRNVLIAAALVARRGVIEREDLVLVPRALAPPPPATPPATPAPKPPATPEGPEDRRARLAAALAAAGGNRAEAARALGVGRSTFYRWLAELEG